jgi:hypothetical protein
MTDEQTESPYFWQYGSTDEAADWAKDAFFKRLAEVLVEVINKKNNDLSYDETTQTLSVGRSE